MNITLAAKMEMREADCREGIPRHDPVPGPPRSAGIGPALPLANLADALRLCPADTNPVPMARSVQRAIDHVRAHPHHGLSIHDLAQAAGVTAGTLRRNFRTCLGVSVTQLVQQLRLEWVRSRLESATESRSITDLSLAAGFGASGMLARAYQRRFGETPSQTRARAFGAPLG